MKIEDEKKLVAEFMGWEFGGNSYEGYKLTPQTYPEMALKRWSPQSPDCPDSVWQDIWGKMDEDMWVTYINKLKYLTGYFEADYREAKDRAISTAPNEIKWKALITTLEGK